MRVVLLTLLLGALLPAQAQIRFASFTSQPQSARLSACAAEVVADPFIATTKLTLDFQNPGKDTIEGRYQFDLPEGMMVAGFQLELNGNFRDGSIEERWKARNAYQEITGKRIDPALLEMTWRNHYTVRIFPIAPQATRRVRIIVKQLLKMNDGAISYDFPLESVQKLDRFSASVLVKAGSPKPATGRGFLADRFFGVNPDGYYLQKTEQGTVALQGLSFSMLIDKPVVSCLWAEGTHCQVLAHLRTNVPADASLNFAGLRLKSGASIDQYWQKGSGWTIRANIRQADTLQILYTNGLKRGVAGEFPLTPPDTCISTDAALLSALVHFDDVVRGSWNGQLLFGIQNGVVTMQSAYIVLERVEDYIRYGIRPPKELEEECALRNYVWKDNTHALQGWTDADLLQEAAREYGARLSLLDRNAAGIVIDKQDVALTGSSKGPGLLAGLIGGNAGSGYGNVQAGGGMEEVVVTALGIRRKPASIGYAYSVVRAEQITAGRSPNLGWALSGKVSGLLVQNASADVNAKPNIILRGMRSLTGSNALLIVVDGVAVPATVINYINPNDVQHIDVIKGGQASALFGSEGVNGAILITLKKGSDNYYRYHQERKPYKLKNLEDVDYVLSLRAAKPADYAAVYQQLRLLPENRYTPLFYFDMAKEFWKVGMKEEAVGVLTSAFDANGKQSPAVLRGTAYIFEEWGMYTDAIELHKLLLRQQQDFQSVYDLGLCLYQAGRYQDAVQCFYEGITMDRNRYDYGYFSWHALMMQELNEIVETHRGALDLSGIPKAILKPVTTGLRIQSEMNCIASGNLYVSNKSGALGGYQNVSLADKITEYTEHGKGAGIYQVMLNNFFDIYHGTEPVLVRIMYRQRDASGAMKWTVRTQVLNNQWGPVEVDDWDAGK